MTGRTSPATVLRAATPGKHRTFCVLGVPRGGTSMVSGLLAQLGVPMGVDPGDANQEDPEFILHSGMRTTFTDAAESDKKREYLDHLEAVVERRNRDNKVWGWKDPIAGYYVADLATRLRNPHYVVVTRDPAAVATRELVHAKSKDPSLLSLLLRRALVEYAAINDFVLDSGRPALFISYERALRHPAELIRTLHGFIDPGAEGDPARLDELVRYVEPERGTGQTDVPAQTQPPGPAQGADLDPAVELALTAAHAPPLDISQVTGSGASALFGAAADTLLAGNPKQADMLAAAGLLSLTDRAPIVRSGPDSVAAAARAGNAGLSRAAELVVGCYNVRAMAALATDPESAYRYFAAGYHVARAALSDGLGRRPMCEDLVWSMAFHSSYAARKAGMREPGLASEIGTLAVNQSSAAQLRARAINEGILE